MSPGVPFVATMLHVFPGFMEEADGQVYLIDDVSLPLARLASPDGPTGQPGGLVLDFEGETNHAIDDHYPSYGGAGVSIEVIDSFDGGGPNGTDHASCGEISWFGILGGRRAGLRLYRNQPDWRRQSADRDAFLLRELWG